MLQPNAHEAPPSVSFVRIVSLFTILERNLDSQASLDKLITGDSVWSLRTKYPSAQLSLPRNYTQSPVCFAQLHASHDTVDAIRFITWPSSYLCRWRDSWQSDQVARRYPETEAPCLGVGQQSWVFIWNVSGCRKTPPVTPDYTITRTIIRVPAV